MSDVVLKGVVRGEPDSFCVEPVGSGLGSVNPWTDRKGTGRWNLKCARVKYRGLRKNLCQSLAMEKKMDILGLDSVNQQGTGSKFEQEKLCSFRWRPSGSQRK